MKMSVVDSSLSSAEGRALSSFHHFFLRFQYKHLHMFLPTAASVKISEKRYEIR